MDTNDADENDEGNFPGIARVPRAGDGVAPPRTFPDAKPVEDALYFRRRLPHFHVHLLMQPWPKENDGKGNVVFWPVSDLLHSIKSFSAHQINKIEKKAGAVWERERFDRYVRSDRDLREKFRYILRNPWDSGVTGQNEHYPWIWTQEDELRKESSSRRDSATNARDARATQSTERNSR